MSIAFSVAFFLVSHWFAHKEKATNLGAGGGFLGTLICS
jgi:hypothetical protein